MKQTIAAAAIAVLAAGPALADGFQGDAVAPPRVIEETAGSNVQQIILPAMMGAAMLFAIMLVTKADG